MGYTVKQVSEKIGVSIRTLHWYDKIDLLKPAYHKSNGYRYYEEEQLATLQQILFYRELGFKLEDIKALLLKDTYSQISTLNVQKHHLEKDIKNKKKLIHNIDKTISHLKANQFASSSQV